ncbi:GNAT family N-acetyltransferase [Streptomyces melanogenes]|uniref:GNAT family N-acetyltransferase n=1 Tax=Streptomyces melanogenes TaxID=67326 RepID=A0ABZ1XD76_9ACTN|nr:GNAT family N-acetyltransferase [Streptomyces melanogenes]
MSEPDGAVVGDAGFHRPPDEAGMVEVGFSVVPGYRRQGCARAMLRALLVRAAAEPAVRTVRARVKPDNDASLATHRRGLRIHPRRRTGERERRARDRLRGPGGRDSDRAASGQGRAS